MTSGKFLVTRLGLWPETKFFRDLAGVRKFVNGWGRHEYRVFRVNPDGNIQRCNLTGALTN